MLIPRYSLRSLLIGTTLAAVYSLIVSYAFQGRAWAVGLAAAAGTLVLVLLVHIGLFAMAQVFVALRKASRRPAAGASPFASAGPPRQLVAPIDPD